MMNGKILRARLLLGVLTSAIAVHEARGEDCAARLRADQSNRYNAPASAGFDSDGDDVIDVFDILAVLDAFAGDPGCCTP